jgi:2-oxoadipate dioxygenase/decarboxylase-like protein
MKNNRGVLYEVLSKVIGSERAERLFNILVIHPEIAGDPGPQASRAVIAQALNMLLFEDLLARVPSAKTYVEHSLAKGATVMHDHGAVRTVALEGMGPLPAGQESITRVLRPLGYALNGVYPLERLKMTGRSHAQADYPEEIAQFFISELHPERFSPEFQAAVARITATSKDPVTPEANTLLQKLDSARSLSVDESAKLLPVLVSCFSRQHGEPALADYEVLLAESPEMAWISTEGTAFNHATDRVADVDQLAEELKAIGLPMKATVENSQSGRVRQTATLAARVQRKFRDANGALVEKEVPGSFYEFITRLPLPEEEGGKKKLDLSFDSSNAQAIFKMTAGTKS